MQFLVLVLAVFAFRGLNETASQGSGGSAEVAREIEEWFFLPTDSSPLVVVLLASWLLYRRRARLLALLGEPPALAWAGGLLGLALALFAWATYTGALQILVFSLSATLLGVAALWGGRSALGIALVPALLVLFAAPLPPPLLAEVVFRFQIWTAEIAGWLLFVIGVPAYVTGDQILLADSHFSVIEGCSGLRSVQTLTMVSVLIVDLFGRRGWHAAALVLASPLVAFALNGVRVLVLILNPHSEIAAIHNLQGVSILLAGLAVIYALDGLLERFSRQPELPPPPERVGRPGRGPSLVATGVVAAMALLSLLLPRHQLVEIDPELLQARNLLGHVGGWQGSNSVEDRSFLGTVGYRTLVSRRFVQGPEGRVEFLLLIGELEDSSRSPISPKATLPGSGWHLEERGVRSDASGREVHWALLRSGTRRVLVHHWYEGSYGLLGEVARSLLALDSSFLHRPSEIMLVRLVTDVVGVTQASEERAHSRLDAFVASVEPELTGLRPKLVRKAGS